MIGIGTWEAPINTMVYKGTGIMKISDVNGEYDFKFELVGQRLPEIKISELAEDGNTLTGIGQCDILKGQRLPFSLTFDGDTFSGFLKAPIVGKVKINGKKIA